MKRPDPASRCARRTRALSAAPTSSAGRTFSPTTVTCDACRTRPGGGTSRWARGAARSGPLGGNPATAARGARIEFVHVGGVTQGMRVAWRFEPGEAGHVSIEHQLELGWPFIGAFAAQRVIGPQFIEAIAGRTLRRMRMLAEGMAETPAGGHHRHRCDHPDRQRRRRAVGRRPRRRIGGAGPSIASTPAHSRRGSPPRSTISIRRHLDARRARRLDRFSALSVAAARMALEDAG